jgi:FAD/FMN-containing dehydrogenase/Fe-S oxidoreductase
MQHNVTVTVAGLLSVPDPREVAAALRKSGLTDVDTSTRRRAEYSSDASNYRVVPAAVVFPRHADDVAAALAACRDLGVPLTARGAGTSIAGNAVGAGVVLDFSPHLNHVLTVDPEARTAVVEPGAVLDSITAAAAPYGLRFGPDPSTHSRATIGGAIANNACGSRALKYGRTADNVTELEVITGSGASIWARGLMELRSVGGDVGLLATRLDWLVNDQLALIRTEFGRFTRQVSGYSLEHLLPENGGSLARFLVGTEGTLAITTKATVRLVSEPPAVALAVLGYADMATAADAVPAVLPHKPVAIEGMDARLVAVMRARRGNAAVPDLPRGDGWLFVETAGETLDEARAAAAQIVADAGAIDATVVTGAAARTLWRIREDGAGLGGRTPGNEPAWPGWEDAAVPPENLGAYLRDFTDLMREHQLDALVYGHFGDGCIHARIDFPFRTAPLVYRQFVTDAATLVARFGGSMSGEHGDGRARSELLPFMYSPEAIAAFGAIKSMFDQDNVLNPGVIVAPAPIDEALRVPHAHPITANLGFSYRHDGGDFSTAVHRCVGVGKCRADTTGVGGVMCPSYLATRDEKDSTRARARVLQEVANGSLVHGFGSREVADSLDLCLACKGCASDCPTGIDMATYKSEALYQRYRKRLRPLSHYSLGRLPRWAALAAGAPGFVNALMRMPPIAATAKRLGGIDRRRPLPRFASRTFRRWFVERSEVVGRGVGPGVLLWIDTFTNHFSPEVGRAAVQVLESAGYAVRIVDEPVCCGLTWISTGQLDEARKQLERTLTALEPAIADGLPIVGLEPSCTAVLRSDLAELLPTDPRVPRVQAATVTLAELLDRTPDWAPPSLADVHGVAQPHCHQHAVLGWDADARLLASAGAQIHAVGGCCGLAGNFGVERGHYDVSVAVAETALLPAVRTLDDGGVVLADGFSCRTQLDQLAGRVGDTRARHLAEVLAERLD